MKEPVCVTTEVNDKTTEHRFEKSAILAWCERNPEHLNPINRQKILDMKEAVNLKIQIIGILEDPHNYNRHENGLRRE